MLMFGVLVVSCNDKDTVTAPEMNSTDFVNITDVVPDAILEIRYFGTYNFVGARIDGYEQPTALLTRRAADSLRAVSDELKAQGYRLKIYDAYRPQCGVDHFVRWGKDLADTLMKPYFYPNESKDSLFIKDYIATRSGHSRGSTLDLTIFDMRTENTIKQGETLSDLARYIRLVRPREPSRLLRQPRNGRIQRPGRHLDGAAVREPHDPAPRHAGPRLQALRLRVVALHPEGRALPRHLLRISRPRIVTINYLKQ